MADNQKLLMADDQKHSTDYDAAKKEREFQEVCVEHIRVFTCHKPQDDGFESEYNGVFIFNLWHTHHEAQPETVGEIVQESSPDMVVMSCFLEALCVIGNDNHESWLDFATDIVEESGLFEHSGSVAKEIADYLRNFFRFESGRFDSIAIAVDANKHLFSKDYLECKEELLVDNDHQDDEFKVPVENIAEMARKCWGEQGRDMELEEVKPKMTVEKLEVKIMKDGNYRTRVKKRRREEEDCSICISPLAGKVEKNSRSRLRWLPENRAAEIVRLACGHAFHHQCIFDWLPNNQSCPLCRSSSLTCV